MSSFDWKKNVEDSIKDVLIILVTLHLLPLPLQSTIRLLPLLMPQDHMILMSMALVYLLSLPLVFVYFLDITLSSLKNSSMKNKINHQSDALYLRKKSL